MTVLRLLAVVVALGFLAGSAWAAGEKPQPLDDKKLAPIVRGAPECPGPLADLDLKLRLIDFIDCASDKDPHGFMDQGTSAVTSGPAGRYRVTAAHRHAFFSYRFRSAGKDKPVLLVIEYPDDARRNICFLTHESGLTGRANNDWSLETGVYCGEPLPLSNKMQYHTFIYWPQDEWPAVIVANWSRTGPGGAAARVWVYAIDAPLPKLDVKEPDPANPRRLGHYNSIHFLPTDLHFGYRSPNAVEHMLDYAEYVGVNELSWTVVYNNTWGFSCKIPSWDGGDKSDHLDRVLTAMDQRGGMAFVAGFYLGGDFKVGGKTLMKTARRTATRPGDKEPESLSPEELKAALFKGFDEFLDNYGKYKSLKGVALGAMYGIECIDPWAKSGLLSELVAHIKAKKPDLLVETYVGGRNLHQPYFSGRGAGEEKTPSTWDVVSGWEASGKPWSQYIGQQAAALWKEWKHDPAELRKAGLTVLEQLQPDDAGVFDYYGSSPDPRAMIYYDLDRSQARSDAVASNRAAMWNTHYEGWLGLDPNVNFWYRKLWVAPDFLPPEPLSMAPFANTLGLRDRIEIIPGSWNNKFFGHEATVRKFAKAFRELPAVDMKDLSCPVDTAKVRFRFMGNMDWYFNAVSLIPFESEIKWMGKSIRIPPYGMVSFTGGVAATQNSYNTVSAQPCAAYQKFVEGRIAEYRKLISDVRSLDANAVPAVYDKVADEANQLVAAGRLYAADIALGAGLVNEMRLRKALLAPPELACPKIDAAPQMKGDLDAWPKAAADIRAETGDYIASHMYFPNSWSGLADLSVRLRLAHDGTKLYVGAMVHDNVLEKNDSASFGFSKAAYMDWKPASQRMDFSWLIDLPLEKAVVEGKGRNGFTYTCRKVTGGYLVEGSAPLAELGLQPGDSIGFIMSVSDTDATGNLKASAWARKQVMAVPNRPTFEHWSDARNCGRIVLGK